ncbi:hypothetical protein ACFLWS_07490 [Chloroflexota bacterium]
MLTIFTTPKPFSGHTEIIQINAIRSWFALDPRPEIILIGNDEGTAEAASRLEVKHVVDVVHNEYGTPLINSIFDIARDISSYPLLCYVNADIILLNDFLAAVQRVHLESFLMVGQRWDLEVNEMLNFDDAQWESQLRARIAEHGKLHSKSGIDYFVYPRGLYDNIPPFAIGRTSWDNWFIYRALSAKAAVIDATKAITAIHQNHDYSHSIGGETGVWKGPEAVRNQELAGYGEHALTLEYANWTLTSRRIRRALTLRNLYFRLDAATRLVSYLHFLRGPMKMLTRLLITIRSELGITED